MKKEIETNGIVDLFDPDVLDCNLDETVFKYKENEFRFESAAQGILNEQIKVIKQFKCGEKIQVINPNLVAPIGCFGFGGQPAGLFSLIANERIHCAVLLGCETDKQGVLTDVKPNDEIIMLLNDEHFLVDLKAPFDRRCR